jgi:hypothetical protein
MKNVFLISCFVFLIISCKNSSPNKISNAIESQINSDTLSVDAFLANQVSLVDQQVIVKGMVAHVCKHGGQKLFLLGTLPDKFLRINTGENIAEFPVDLEGSTIEVKGVVTEFELDPPEPDSTSVPETLESDTSSLEKAYHKDNFYVIVAESYKALE